MGDIKRFLNIFSNRHQPIFPTFGEMIDADKIMNPHFGSDPAGI